MLPEYSFIKKKNLERKVRWLNYLNIVIGRLNKFISGIDLKYNEYNFEIYKI